MAVQPYDRRMGDPPSRLIAILAGGRGRRMGGVDKAFLSFCGTPMIAHLSARLGPQAGTLVINSNADPAEFDDFGLPVLRDTIPDRPGPLAGVVAALDWAALRGISEVVTVPVDLPFVPLDLVPRLAEAKRSAIIACAASQGRRHGIVALWPSALADDLRRMVVEDGVRRVDDALARWSVAVAEFDGAGPDPFLNLNRPEDLAAAELLAAGADLRLHQEELPCGDGPDLAKDLAEIARHRAALPVPDERTAEEILGYDANGLPS